MNRLQEFVDTGRTHALWQRFAPDHNHNEVRTMKDLILIYGHNRLKEVAAKFREDIAKAPKEEQKTTPSVQLRVPHLFDIPESHVIAVVVLDGTDAQRTAITEAYRRKGAHVLDENGKVLAEPYPPEDETNKGKELPQVAPTGDGSEHQLPNEPQPTQAADEAPVAEESNTTESGDPVDPSVMRQREKRSVKKAKK